MGKPRKMRVAVNVLFLDVTKDFAIWFLDQNL